MGLREGCGRCPGASLQPALALRPASTLCPQSAWPHRPAPREHRRPERTAAHSRPASQTAPAAAPHRRLSRWVLTREAAGAGQTDRGKLPATSRTSPSLFLSSAPVSPQPRPSLTRRPAGLSPAQPAGTAAVGGRLAEMQREEEGPRVRAPQTPAPAPWLAGSEASVCGLCAGLVHHRPGDGLSVGDSRKESWPSKHPSGTGLWPAGPWAGGTRSA